jgi:hypothetical protein
MLESWNDGRMEGRREESFPQCGPAAAGFSTVWKNPAQVFHGVEKTAENLPQCGKLFSHCGKPGQRLAFQG